MGMDAVGIGEASVRDEDAWRETMRTPEEAAAMLEFKRRGDARGGVQRAPARLCPALARAAQGVRSLPRSHQGQGRERCRLRQVPSASPNLQALQGPCQPLHRHALKPCNVTSARRRSADELCGWSRFGRPVPDPPRPRSRMLVEARRVDEVADGLPDASAPRLARPNAIHADGRAPGRHHRYPSALTLFLGGARRTWIRAAVGRG